MTGKVVAYARVSSTDQNPGRQIESINAFLNGRAPDKVFTDKQSGKDLARPELQRLLDFVREDDLIVVASIDRLGRSLVDLHKLIADLAAKGVAVTFVKESMVFDGGKQNAMAGLMFNMLASFAEFERALIRERQAEGIALAKTKGKYKGRKPTLDSVKVAELKQRLAGGANRAEVAREFGISRAATYRYQPNQA